MTYLSFATVLYNNSKSVVDNLVDNLSAVTSQYKKVDIYLINNSPDNKILSRYLVSLSEHEDKITVLSSGRNSGFGSGNNLVLKGLKSDYHFLVNPDITINNARQLEKMISFMDSHEEYGMLSPLIKFPDGEVQHLLKKQSTVFDMLLRFIKIPGFTKRRRSFVNLPDGYSTIHLADNVPGSFMLFRTSVFKKIKGFDERYFLYMEDSDITRKVNEVSETVFFPDAFVYHEWQRQNRKSVKGILQMLCSTVKYFNKWGWKLL